jgi:hypothetical protein
LVDDEGHGDETDRRHGCQSNAGHDCGHRKRQLDPQQASPARVTHTVGRVEHFLGDAPKPFDRVPYEDHQAVDRQRDHGRRAAGAGEREEQSEQRNGRDRVERVHRRHDDRRDRTPARREDRERQRNEHAVEDREERQHDVLARVRVDVVLVIADPAPPHPRVGAVGENGSEQARDGTFAAR